MTELQPLEETRGRGSGIWVSSMSPKRFQIGPLGEHDDDWLTIWSWLVGRSKSSQVASLVSARIRDRKPEIIDMLNYVAEKRGVTSKELAQRIVDGTADENDEPMSGE